MSEAMKAGRLLTRFLKQIGEEETELVKDDNGEDRLASKMEACARNMWDIALGATYQTEDPVTKEAVDHKRTPDKGMMSLIFDRIEGRAPNAVTEADETLSVADRITEQGKNRISSIGNFNVDPNAKAKT